VSSDASGDLRSDLGRVRGLGSAKEGVHHWWMQRLSAIVLVPLSIWFVAALIAHTGAGYHAVSAWLASPVVFGVMVLLVGATFYHAALGLQVIIEDYVHREATKIAALLLIKFSCVLLALAAIVSLLVIAFGR
jgi:succinate dehydrogenase / fumarate reductase, membrane anchor subunit